MSPTLQGSEVLYPVIEKEPTANHRSYQKVVVFVIKTKIYNCNRSTLCGVYVWQRPDWKSRITKYSNGEWRLYRIRTKSSTDWGGKTLGQIPFCQALCASVSKSSTLKEIQKNLCHPGITWLLHFVCRKNLPYSTSDIKQVVSSCEVRAKMKPNFIVQKKAH